MRILSGSYSHLPFLSRRDISIRIHSSVQLTVYEAPVRAKSFQLAHDGGSPSSQPSTGYAETRTRTHARTRDISTFSYLPPRPRARAAITNGFLLSVPRRGAVDVT